MRYKSPLKFHAPTSGVITARLCCNPSTCSLVVFITERSVR